MSGRRSRDNGARIERAIAEVRRASAYQPVHDIVLSLGDRDLCVEVKARADGFRELYSWLDGRDVLIVKADHKEPLVVLRMSLAAEIAERGAV
jgi:hypothetical protein